MSRKPKFPKFPGLDAIRAEAAAAYVAEFAGLPLSPAKTTAALAAKYGVPSGPLVGLVAEVYYAGNGREFPILPKKTRAGRVTELGLAKAVRERRDARGRLGRWDVIRYAVAAGRGDSPDARPTDSAVRELYAKGGGDLATSYTGRGTRAGVPATRESATAELGLANE
jgi:hypothetical protein